MSKTRGNVVDPIDLIERYGADSLRFYLCTMAGQELGIVFSQARVEGYRNFCNKLWNAARFTRMNVEGYEPGAFIERVFARHDISTLSSADLWILARTIETCADVDTHLASYRLDLAAHAAYQFVWRELCDWYIELAKSQLRSADEHRVHATRGVLTVVFDVVVRLLHPMIPFITEELRTHLPKPPGSAPVVIVDTYPQVLARDPSGRPTRCAGYLGEVEALLAAAPTQQAKDDMQRVMEVVTSVRGLKAQFKLSPAQPVVVQVRAEGVGGAEMVERIAPAVTHLARLERLEVLGSDAVASSQSATEIVRGLEVFLPLAGLIDIDAERARMQKEFDKRTQEIESLRRKLGNESFCAKAPAHVVQKERERLQELRVTTERLQATLQRLASSA
jgi:valyl-tRNA synthetase